MKLSIKTTALSLAVIAMASTAVAGHHEGGKDGKHHGAKMFEKLDTNKDGVISLQEHQKHSAERFLKMDTNADGVVSPEEGKTHKAQKRDKMKQRRQQKRFNAPKAPVVPTPPAAPDLNASE